MKATVVIERSKSGRFSAYIAENVGFGILGEGVTVQETIADFYNSRDEMRAIYERDGKVFPELEYVFLYDDREILI